MEYSCAPEPSPWVGLAQALGLPLTDCDVGANELHTEPWLVKWG